MLARSNPLISEQRKVGLARTRLLWLLLPAIAVFALDHLTKWLITTHLALGAEWPLHAPVVLHHIENSGAAFGLFPSLGWLYPLVALAVAVFIVGYGHRFAPLLWQQAVLGVILGGAVSNAVDRVAQGHVTDFFDFRIWPVFNVADCGIVIGIVICIFFFRKSDTDDDN